METKENFEIENMEREVTVDELIKLAVFLRNFRIIVAKRKGPYFWGPKMCHLDDKNGMRLYENEVVIRTGNQEFKIPESCIYYDSLKNLLEDMFKKFNKRKIIKRIDFLTLRVVKRYNKILKESSDEIL